MTAGDLGVRVPVLGTDETGRLAESFNQMVAGLEERERLREAFGAFVDPQLAERVLEEGTVLEGEEVEVTVLFVDIREFTAFAERASATRGRRRAQRASTSSSCRCSSATAATPTSSSATACSASSARPSTSPTTPTAAWRRRSRSPRSCAAPTAGGCASASASTPGPVVAGTIGGGGRVEFTVIGDTVNTAARVEALTRETDDTVLVTDATCALLQRDHGGFAERGTVTLRGRSEPVTLHVAHGRGGRARGAAGARD